MLLSVFYALANDVTLLTTTGLISRVSIFANSFDQFPDYRKNYTVDYYCCNYRSNSNKNVVYIFLSDALGEHCMSNRNTILNPE